VGALKGKTTQKTPTKVTAQITAVPMEVLDQHQQITVSTDIIFINKVVIFVTISHGIRFGTTEMIQNKKAETLVECMKHIHDIYSQYSFTLQVAIMDGKFETHSWGARYHGYRTKHQN